VPSAAVIVSGLGLVSVVVMGECRWLQTSIALLTQAEVTRMPTFS
jgi:hypothetical protein